jgi:hypothetical protein
LKSTIDNRRIKRYIGEILPEEYEKCLVGLTAILREAWSTSYRTEDKREKIQALSLAKECYPTKLELLTNAKVVDDANGFVSNGSNEKQKISSYDINEDDKKEESKEHEYDDDEDEDQSEEQQEEQTGEVAITTNQVF